MVDVTLPLPRSVLIDTNILLLLMVGAADKGAIARFKRTRQRFTSDDFDIATNFLSQFNRMATTASILTETSNLAFQLESPFLHDVLLRFANWVDVLEEKYLPGREIVADPAFRKFGFTDAGISALRSSEYLVLTDDLPLAQFLESANVPVFNFNHIRFYAMRES